MSRVHVGLDFLAKVLFIVLRYYRTRNRLDIPKYLVPARAPRHVRVARLPIPVPIPIITTKNVRPRVLLVASRCFQTRRALESSDYSTYSGLLVLLFFVILLRVVVTEGCRARSRDCDLQLL